jgi:hypothetical protein
MLTLTLLKPRDYPTKKYNNRFTEMRNYKRW